MYCADDPIDDMTTQMGYTSEICILALLLVRLALSTSRSQMLQGSVDLTSCLLQLPKDTVRRSFQFECAIVGTERVISGKLPEEKVGRNKCEAENLGCLILT